MNTLWAQYALAEVDPAKGTQKPAALIAGRDGALMGMIEAARFALA
jgi:hypothetical protein